MSAELLARKAVAELQRMRDEKVKSLRRCKPRPPTVTETGGVIGATTAEELAFYAVDVNATVDTLNLAIEIIEEQFKKLTQPEDPPEESTPEDPQARKNLYG